LCSNIPSIAKDSCFSYFGIDFGTVAANPLELQGTMAVGLYYSATVDVMLESSQKFYSSYHSWLN